MMITVKIYEDVVIVEPSHISLEFTYTKRENWEHLTLGEIVEECSKYEPEPEKNW